MSLLAARAQERLACSASTWPLPQRRVPVILALPRLVLVSLLMTVSLVLKGMMASCLVQLRTRLPARMSSAFWPKFRLCRQPRALFGKLSSAATGQAMAVLQLNQAAGQDDTCTTADTLQRQIHLCSMSS